MSRRFVLCACALFPSLPLSLFSSLCLNVCKYACFMCVCVCVSHSRVVGSRQDPIDGATGVVGRG